MTITEVLLAISAFSAVGSMAVGVATLYTAREVKHATNSMKDELVAVTRSDATQDGITQGRAMEKADANNVT